MIVEQIWIADSGRDLNYLIARAASPARCRCRSPSGAAAAEVLGKRPVRAAAE